MAEAIDRSDRVEPMGLFPHFFFRTTGFPVEHLDRLACPRSLELAREVLEAEISLDGFAKRFLDKVQPRLREGSDHPALSSAARKVRRRRPVSPEKLEAMRAVGLESEAAELSEFNGLVANLEREMHRGEAVLKEELAVSQTAIARLVGDERFQEAVLLSAPGSLESLARLGRGTNGDHPRVRLPNQPRRRGSHGNIRRKALLYLQRLCSKNETISFFGPITWGGFADGGPSNLDLVWRDEELSSRHVFFEHWGAAFLASAMESDPELAEQLPWSVRHPYAWTAEGGLVRSFYVGVTKCRLEPIPASVVAAIQEARDTPGTDPRPSVGAILDRLAASSGLPRPALFDGFQSLRKAGVLGALTVPIETLGPMEELRKGLAPITSGHPALARWDQRISTLLGLKGRFEKAGYSSRRELLSEIEACFTQWTDKAPRRNGGQTYGARNLIYEDCTRHPERFRIGGTLRADMESDLREVLDVQGALLDVVMPYGWRRLEEIHRDLSTGGRSVRLPQFMSRLRGSVGASYLDARLMQPSDREGLLAKARQVLDLRRTEGGDLRVAASAGSSRTGARLLGYPVVLAADVMIAARDRQAVESGDYEFVIGEIQYFPLGYPEYFGAFHPRPEEFAADYLERITAPRRTALPLIRLEVEPEVSRLLRVERPLADYVLVDVYGRPVDPARPQRLGMDLTVVLEDGRVLVEDRAGDRFLLGNPFFDLFLDAGWKLLAELHRQENATRDAPAQMRIGSRTILLRREWVLEGADLAPANGQPGWEKAPFSQFAAMQRLRRRRGLPRFAFARFADEVKPVLVDFDSPLLLENLAHMTPPNGAVRLSEMRPSRDELWMTSSRGHHTSELRVFLS